MNKDKKRRGICIKIEFLHRSTNAKHPLIFLGTLAFDYHDARASTCQNQHTFNKHASVRLELDDLIVDDLSVAPMRI